MTKAFADHGLMEARELATLLTNNDRLPKLVDGTFTMPGAPVSARDMFLARRIANAVHFDIDRIADPDSDMPHMIPPPADFETAVSALGISNDDLVVVYDQFGISMAAARVWWMFRLFGHDNVCVLNGGLPYWEATGHLLNTDPCAPPPPAAFRARFRPELVKTMTDIRDLIDAPDACLLDARSAERFSGHAPEPRKGLRAGHIPGSDSLPFTNLIDRDGRLKDAATLRQMLAGFNADQIVATCGSGVTACVIALGFYTIGKKDVSVYDGSWAEWGREDQQTPVAILAS